MKGFKKDFSYYLAGIIIPGGINFLSIPIIKNIIGPAKYGVYSIFFNAFLIVVSGIVGWLGVSIVRFRIEYKDSITFNYHIGKVLFYIGLSTAVISFILLFFYFNYSFLLSILFGVAFFLACFQNGGIALSQANFRSKETAFSESIRSFIFFFTCILLLKFNNNSYLDIIFFSVALSYFISALILKKINNISLRQIMNHQPQPNEFEMTHFIKYGIPLSFWFLCSFLIPFLDKPVIAKTFGNSIQGNYQAMFDIISRGIALVLSPLLIASFPYMTVLKNENNIRGLFLFFLKLIVIEIGALLIILILYFKFSGILLDNLLHIPDKSYFFKLGLMVIIASFLWQFAMLLHKPLEIEKKTHLMLIDNFIALIVSILVLITLNYFNYSLIYYPFVFISGALTYIILCLYQGRHIFFLFLYAKKIKI